MSIKRNVKFLATDLKGTNGFMSLMNALVTSICILGILAALVWFGFSTGLDLPGASVGIVLAFFILNTYGQDKKMEKMEKRMLDDEAIIKKLSKKDKGIDLNKLNEQMKDMQDE